MKTALILGVTGQDGSYCAELLLKKNYKVHGMVRKSSTSNTKNINHLLNDDKIINKKLFIEHGDMLDHISLAEIISKTKPDEIYNFADQDHVRWSFEIPIYSYNVTVNSVLSILEIIRKTNPKIKYFQPISSNIFGNLKSNKFNERSDTNPQSIYAVGKTSAYLICKMYQKIYNLKIYGAIFFNHESPRRSAEYVTQKIIQQSCEIYFKKRKNIYLGDISAKIDWGYAKDYVFYSWKIMQTKNPDFYVIATGKTTSVKEFLSKVFNKLELNISKHLRINKKLIRPSKTSVLTGDTSKAQKSFNYKIKTDIDNLIDIMLTAELKKYEK
ncbi:GDP-mannose 4,6-dehydratase [Pelagibacteraceae bacterium]|nr:GDP-mannose 4,6-dehydratase [Pelagibacteraceae bacterium]